MQEIHAPVGPLGSPWRAPSAPTEQIDLGRVLRFGAKVLLAWKALQYLTDEDYGDGEYPRIVRRDLIDEHVQAEGCYCPDCDRRVPRASLTVDHAWPMSRGGRTSLNNARVICGRCNSRKGNRLDLVDMLRGVC